jgi:hypothetical protein
MIPAAGLLLIQPLSGDGREIAADLVRKEEDILPWLGRADLLNPLMPLAIENFVEEPLPDPVPDVGSEISPDEPSADTNEEEVEETAGVLPRISAGEGPGTVEGVVFDSDGNGIAGVIITLLELSGFQVRSDQRGGFRITGLPATGVSAEFLKSAFVTKVDVLQIKEEGVTKVRIPLEFKPVELADGEYLLEGQEVILDYQEEDTGGIGMIADAGPGLAGGGLSKGFISKSGASDAAGAVGKISGANVVGGKFVVVRGLGDRYNNTTLNGGIVPSPETSRKAVQLDLFPSDALEGVAIKKTAAPNVPADFVGGIVQLQTLKESPDDFLSVAVKTKSDQSTRRHGKFFTVPGMGLSDDLKPDNPVPVPTFRTNASGADAQAQRQAFFDAVSFKPRKSSPGLDREISAAFSKSWELSGNSRFSLLGSLNHSQEQRFRRTEQSRFQNAIQLTNGVSPDQLNPRFADPGSFREIGGATLFDGLVGNFTQDTYTQSKELSVLVSGKLEVGDNLELNGTFFNFRSGDSSYTLIDNGVTNLADFDLESQADSLARGSVVLDGYAANSYRQIYDLVYRELQFGQLGGAYRFDDWREGAQITWNAYQSETSESSPRTYELLGYFVRELGGGDDPVSGITIPNPANTANPNSSGFVAYETADESREYKMDGVLPLFEKTEDRKMNVIAGFGQYKRDRESNTQSAILASGGGLTSVQGAIDATDDLLNDRETGSPNSVQGTEGFVPGSSALGVTQTYFGSNEIDSLYLGLDAGWDGWFLLGGFRFEEETRSFEIPGGRRGISQTTISDDIYPSLDFGRSFGAEKQLKAIFSYSETVVRPTFYEFIPARILDLSNQRVIVGNRDLRETQSQNFDFSLTWKKENNYAGINLFHKVISDPIFTINDPSGAADRTFVNLGETEVSGLELEGSYELGGGFSVTGNISFIKASAQPGQVRVNNQDFLGQIDRLEGQPDLLGNLILSWENEDAGISTNLIYNYTGEYLTVASLGFVGDPDSALPNEVRQPFHSLDWNISKKWETDFADYKVKFQVRNILNSDVEVRYEGLADSIAAARAYSPGREFGLSFEAKF